VTVLCTRLTDEDSKVLTAFLRTFRGRVAMEVDCSPAVTHIVGSLSTDAPPSSSSSSSSSAVLSHRTMKYLKGLMSGHWIVSAAWMAACVAQRRLLPEEPFEATGAGPQGQGPSGLSTKRKAPARARKDVSTHGRSRLFDRYVVTLQGNFPAPLPTKADLSELLASGMAIVVGSVKEMLSDRHNGLNRVVVYGDGTPEQVASVASAVGSMVPVVEYKWVVDSVGSYTVLSPHSLLHSSLSSSSSSSS